MIRKPLLALLACTALVAGCADQPAARRAEPTYESAVSNPFIPTNQHAADNLMAQLGGTFSKSKPLIMATVVDINNLDKSSPLGRTLSEIFSAQLTRNGFHMIEIKFRNSIYIKQSQGELALTREIQELAQSQNAQAVVAGTYSESQDYVFVNLKVIRPGDNVILAVHDYTLPKNSDVRSLLTR